MKYKKFVNFACKIQIYLVALLNYFLFFLLLIIRPFKKIKIFELETRAIGHYSLSIEIFLSEIEKGIIDKDQIYLAITNKTVANKFLLKKWKPFFIIISYKFDFFLNFLRKFKFGHFFLAPYRGWKKPSIPWQYIDINNVLKNSSPFIKFTNHEIEVGNKTLKELGVVNENYVCFNSRSGDYRNDFDSNSNGDINCQIKGIQELTNYGLKAIRMGAIGQPRLAPHPDIIDYANSKYKSEFNDIFLAFNCKFMISNGTGIDRIPILNRKKTIIINYFCNGFHDIHSEFTSIFVPKKIKCLKTGRFLTFQEIFKLGLFNISSKTKLKEFGYLSHENNEDEIRDTIMEMYDLIICKKKIEFIYDLNKSFWDNFEKYNYERPNPGDIMISPSFIKKNLDLF